jgi:hypothetical protein
MSTLPRSQHPTAWARLHQPAVQFWLVCAALCGGLTGLGAAADSAPSAPAVAAAVRHQSSGMEQAGRALFSLTWIGEWGPRDFQRPGRWEQLGRIRAAIDAKDWSGALESFKRYTLEKLRQTDGFNGFGVAPAMMDPWSVGEPRWHWLHPLISSQNAPDILARAKDLLGGTLQVGHERIAIGRPGAIDWHAASVNASRHGSEDWPWRVEAFTPLLAAYIITGERAYMDTWAAYADDWAINQQDGFSAVPADMEDRWGGSAFSAFDLFRYLRGVSLMPGGIDLLPADTFARVVHRLVADYIPMTVLYHRANATNWTDVSIPALADLAFLLDEYRCAPVLLREATRRLELLIPTRHLPDGPDLDITYGYGAHFLLGASGLIGRLDARQAIPAWFAPAWEQAWRAERDEQAWLDGIRTAMRERVRFLLAHATADNENPIGGARNGHHSGDLEGMRDIARALVSDALVDPSTRALETLAEGPTHPRPAFTSECFPVTGLFYQRAGWNAGDPYLFMHCSPHATGGDLSERNANAIGLGAYGCDLLDTGEKGVYDTPHSPLRVDGQEAYFHDGFSSWDHRGWFGGGALGVLPWQQAPAWRWSATSRYDVAEGVYEGGYGRSPHIQGVSHHRQVYFVRRAGMWIVVDHLHGDAEHAFALDWRLPLAPGSDRVFTTDEIAIDPAARTIITHRATGANITLRQFAGSPITLVAEPERSDPRNGYRMHDFLRVSTTWKAASGTVVTAILPRAQAAADLTAVQALEQGDATGFEATAANGVRVRFLAAKAATGSLTIGELHAEAEALLVVDEPGQPRSGIVLSAMGLSVAGHEHALEAANAEFAETGAAFTQIPILTPVANVQIAPADRDGFSGSQEVTLSCPTGATDIRYTTDGSEPTLTSSLYRDPFTISATTIIKARAFRHGTERMPVEMSCRQASLVAHACFTELAIHSSSDAHTMPGLRYETLSGRWEDLLMAPEAAHVTGSGRVDQLFAPASLSPGSVYAVRYRGYLVISTPGVYTFQAPAESYLPNILAGYQLDVVVDGVRWYPATSVHALGSWSIALAAGQHRLEVLFADLRGDAPARRNTPGHAAYIWSGTAPLLELSGPGLPRAPLPAALLAMDSAPTP